MMKLIFNSFFIFMFFTGLLSACRPDERVSPSEEPVPSETPLLPAASLTPEATPAGDYLWILLTYISGMNGEQLKLSVSYYDPATYHTPGPLYLDERGMFKSFLPHVRFRSATRQVVADVPLRLVTFGGYSALDFPVFAEWQALVPDFPEYECLELLSQAPLTFIRTELQPPIRMCAAQESSGN